MLPELTIGQSAVLAGLGLSVGVVGAMVGVGGGFLIVPALLFLYPEATPAQATSISLTAVLFNALSASIGYRSKRTQDFRTAFILIALAAPAAIGGAFITRVIDRGPFETIFGATLVIGALYLLARSAVFRRPAEPARTGRTRIIVQRDGTRFRYRVNEPLAASVAPFAGFFAGFFGIGGGIINMPFMVLALRIPAQVAAATSQVELSAAAAAALTVHLVAGAGDATQWAMAGVVAAGTLLGAQAGVRLATRVSPRLVLGILGAGLLFAGARLLLA